MASLGKITPDRVTMNGIERCCRRCSEWLLLVEFERAPKVKHGRLYVCKLCRVSRPGRNAPLSRAQKDRYNERRRIKYWRHRDQPMPRGDWLRIGDVVRLLGEKEHVVRWWQNQFGLAPETVHVTEGGQCLYPPRAVMVLREIHRLLRVELYTVEGAKRQLRLAAERERKAG